MNYPTVLLHILLGLAIAGVLLAPRACNDKLGNSAWWTHRKLLAVLVAASSVTLRVGDGEGLILLAQCLL